MSSIVRSIGLVLVVVVAASGWLVSAQGDNPSATANKQEKPQTAAPQNKSGEPKAEHKHAEQKPSDQKSRDQKATDEKPGDQKARTSEEGPDERAIRESAVKFVEAYNAHDAKALAQLFAPKAEFIDEDGELIQGREAIEKSFVELFEEHADAVIEVEPSSIRVLTENIAVEEGALHGIPEKDSDECRCSYVAVHTKIDGTWLVASVRDFAGEHDHEGDDDDDATPGERLQELAWMIGEWVDESPDSMIRSVVRWDESENFILNDFTAFIGGEMALAGQMRIGWDPLTRQFKAWVFDSDGGYTEGMWIREGDEWVVKWQGATSDGEAASSTSFYRQIDDDTIGWSSIDRVVDGELTDDIDEVIIKRHPPLPGEDF